MSDATYADNLWWQHAGRVAGAGANTPSAAGEISMWLFEGHPGSGATPTTLVYPTNVTRGAMKQVDPSGGRQKWLCGMAGTQIDSGTFILYDRLAQIGGLSGSISTNQALNSTITRYTNGIGNQLWLEISTVVGSNAGVTAHFDYTDENNNAATTPETKIGGANFQNAQRVIRFGTSVASGSGGKGVKNMTNLKLSATTGATGDLCAVIAHPLMMFSTSQAGVADVHSWIMGNLPVEVLTGACLSLLYIPNGTTLSADFGALHMIEA
jgi:hypothetical protein